MLSIGVKELLEAGVHFGHQTRRWNPKMKPFIFDARNGIQINSTQLIQLLDNASIQVSNKRFCVEARLRGKVCTMQRTDYQGR